MTTDEARSALGGVAIAAAVFGVLFVIIGAVVANEVDYSIFGSDDPFKGLPQIVIGGVLLQLSVLATLFWLLAHSLRPPEPAAKVEVGKGK